MRSHYYRPVTDNSGNILPNVQITLFEPGTTNPIADTVYADATSSTLLTNPFVNSNGLIDFYLANPRRVDIGILQGNLPIFYYRDQDVLAAGSDSPHVGAGTNSTQVGVSGSSMGTNATAFGNASAANGSQSTVIGASSTAGGNQSTIAGAGSNVTGTGGTALGYNTVVGGLNSTAVGINSSAPTVHSTAVGANAVTDANNQVSIGTSSDSVYVPGTLVIQDSTGHRWSITIDTNGDLITAPFV